MRDRHSRAANPRAHHSPILGGSLQDHLREVVQNPEVPSERLARIILDEMYQFVGLLDTEGNLLDVNQAALDGGGIKRSEIIGRPFWEAHWWTVSPETQARLQDAIRDAANGHFVRYEVEVFGGGAGSELITIDFSLKPVRDGGGAVTIILAEGRNITEKKLADAEIQRKNEELRALNEKLQEFDTLKTQFFANVSHELRTPLALILGPSKRLLEEPLTPAQRASVETILRNAHILHKQVNDLLDIAKLDAGKLAVRYAEADLAGVVRLVAGNFDGLAAELGIHFVVEAPSSLPAQVDPDKVERIALNLLSNAFKFTPRGGSIRCTVAAKAAPPAGSRSIVDPRPRAQIEVHDSGPGVPEHLRESIFERFRQGEGGTTRHFGGTGLGLAIVRDLVDLHGGSVAVGASPLGGACFTVEIPLVAPPGAPVDAPRAGASRDTADLAAATQEEVRLQTDPEPLPADHPGDPSASEDKPLVLIVEDNPDMRQFVAEALSPRFRTATAGNGKDGLEKALALRPDVILSDVMMPGISGDQMAQAIRTNPDMNHVPIVLLTAKADDQLRLQMLQGIVQDYVTKPFSSEELLARLDNLARTKRTRDVLQHEIEGTFRDLDVLAQEVAARKRELHEEVEQRRRAETDVRRLNDELERRVAERTRELERLNLELEAFSYSVSHDLKAPLRGIEFFSRVLMEEAADRLTGDQRAYLDRLVAQSHRLNRLVNDLLTLSQVGRTDLNKTEVDITALARAVLEDLRMANPERQGVEVTVAEGLTARSDPALTRLVLENLIGNAWKYTGKKAKARIEVGETMADGERTFFVRDDGAGFDPARTDELFTPFTRLHAPSEFDGTGIGLATVARIVQRHGGAVWAEGRPGLGATIYFTLG